MATMAAAARPILKFVRCQNETERVSRAISSIRLRSLSCSTWQQRIASATHSHRFFGAQSPESQQKALLIASRSFLSHSIRLTSVGSSSM